MNNPQTARALAACRACPRLAGFLGEVKVAHPTYFAAPVPPFGDPDARLIIVGLAPGMHGANRTGRPFTGDFAGILLYQTLHRYGFASAPHSESTEDGLRLHDCFITNAVKCLPPENKPTTPEIATCNAWLKMDLATAAQGRIILALGQIAHTAVLRAYALKQSGFRFGHAARHELPDGRVLFDSYHCSRYNTQTSRLTSAEFCRVFEMIRDELG